MLNRYKEIFFGLLLGIAMWMTDALMHTKMPMTGRDYPPSFTEELLSPSSLQFMTRLLFVAFALFLGWWLWRSNHCERAVRDLERQIAVFHERIINPATSILEECNALLKGEGLTGEPLKLVQEIRQQAHQIHDFAKDFPRRPGAL